MSQNISRKGFLQLAGLAAGTIPSAKFISKIGDYNLYESPEQYGGFLVRRRVGDEPPYEIDPTIFKRFDEYNILFAQAGWNEEYKAVKAALPQDVGEQKKAARVPGFSPFEFALQNGANWLRKNAGAGSYKWKTEPNPVVSEIEDVPIEVITQYTKTAALFLGASGVGIAETNENWFYNSVGWVKGQERQLVFDNVDVPVYGEEGPIIVPKKLNRVIVLVHEMDYDTMKPNGICKLASAGTGQGYSLMAMQAPSVATFIQSLGYQALPMGNDTGQSVPMAIEAGLGEQGRMGVLITPKWGPRVRISKILTDMPLVVDKPITFGVKEFCEKCELCSKYCPSGTIPSGDSFTYETHGDYNQAGVKKWQVNQYSCYLYWTESGTGGCTNCVAVCPFNKPEGWLHEATRILIGAKSGSVDSLLKNMDHAAGYGAYTDQPLASEVDFFWNDKEKFMHTER
ncbi:reductive dehalogenase [bacterium]|nr:reductive dehalogenase [bacterium]